MSLDFPPNNKMMTTPPAKKGFHFAATAEHFAEYIEAATIEEAEELYHKIKRPITVPQNQTAPQSTGAIDPEIKE